MQSVMEEHLAAAGGPPPGQALGKAAEEGGVRSQYSIPGILHFIQHEWARSVLGSLS